MKLRHVLFIGLLTVGFIASPFMNHTLSADDTPNRRAKDDGQGKGPEGLLTRMRTIIDKLNLTSEQKPKVDAAFDDARSKIQSIVKDNAGADREALRGKIQPVIKDLMEKVTAVLTPEQKEELQKARENAPRKGKNSN